MRNKLQSVVLTLCVMICTSCAGQRTGQSISTAMSINPLSDIELTSKRLIEQCTDTYVMFALHNVIVNKYNKTVTCLYSNLNNDLVNKQIQYNNDAELLIDYCLVTTLNKPVVVDGVVLNNINYMPKCLVSLELQYHKPWMDPIK